MQLKDWKNLNFRKDTNENKFNNSLFLIWKYSWIPTIVLNTYK